MQPADVQTPTLPWRLFDGYQPIAGIYDEMLDPAERLRVHAEPFVSSIERLGRHELVSRWENAKRTIRDNGITYNVYGDPQGIDRPWALDLIPLLIAPEEWATLEPALLQRTRLLNLILADIYGPQRLLREHLLPPALVLGSAAFLRPCHGLPVPQGIHLHLHAVDLARSPGGQWSVLADRTQAPSGAGYALENRIVLSRSLPEAFRDCHVQRLASFFRAQRDTLTSIASRGDPRVVLLTPGSNNETYFEHAYLARYLGFPLVEGGDLTVRDRCVFIKTLDGLQPVDVIFRRLDDTFCDPLELRVDSALGVAGLVGAARAGNVAIANALGSGVVETAALAPFLPALCRHLLGEELMLPSAASWWCGDPQDLKYVLDDLHRLVIKRTFAPARRQPVFGRTLQAAQRSVLAREIRAHPAEFVAQEEVAVSTAPVWLGHKLDPRPVILRTYVTAMAGSYIAMPGGLTRVAATADAPIVSMQRGGGSKDTWLIADEEQVSIVSLLPPAISTIPYERRATDVPSRVADNLFWLGRYAERAEHIVRLVRSLVTCMADADTTDETPELLALLQVVSALQLLPARPGAPLSRPDLEREIVSSFFKQGQHSPMRTTLKELRRNATAVRDRLSVDTWRILNQLHFDYRLRHGRIQLDDVLGHLNRMITDLAAFSGMEMENMTRGHGWRFLDVGRRLERAVNTAALLRTGVGAGPSPFAFLRPLLEIADSSMTYRRRYFAEPQLPTALDLLMSDATNTRGIVFQLLALSAHMDHLPRDKRAPSPSKEEQIVAKAIDRIHQADLNELGRPAGDGRFPDLTRVLLAIEDDLRALSDTITYYYFSHAELRIS